MAILLLCSLLCSSDVVAAVSIIDYESQPKLFSCIFGEGVFNDIVSIILFNTVLSLQGEEFTAGTPFKILAQFVLLAVISLAIGIISGVLTSLLFKHLRVLTVSAITETFIIFAFAMVSYFVAELTVVMGLQMSGIISVLTCGVIQAHYTWYNLSPQGKSSTVVTFGFLGTAAEAAVYAYIGIGLYSLIPTWWSFSFSSIMFVMIVLGRICLVVGIFLLFQCCFRKKTLAINELFFISYGGMIRGAIAFALVLKIQVCEGTGEDEKGCYTTEQYELSVTLTMIMVMVTTLLFGTFMKVVQKCLVPPKAEDAAEIEEDRKHAKKTVKFVLGDDDSSYQKSHSSDSEHEEIVHANMQEDSDEEEDTSEHWSFNKSGLVKWFSKFD